VVQICTQSSTYLYANNKRNNNNNNGVSEKYKKWEGLSPTAEKGSPLYEEMVKSRH